MANAVAVELLSDDEHERLKALIGSRNRTATEDIELAVLYLVSEAEDEALPLLSGAIDHCYGASCARIWWAYCALHYLLDQESLSRAAELLRPIVGSSDSVANGAAALLLAQLIQDLRGSDKAEAVGLLESSVRTAPLWVYNHQLLSHAYVEAGREKDAVRELRLAIQAAVHAAIPEELSITERRFELHVTGRLAHLIVESLTSQLRRLEQAK